MRGDTLLNSGVVSRFFYILKDGELKLTFPPESSTLSKVNALLGEGDHIMQNAVNGRRASRRVPQGRIERTGSLIGWAPPHATLQPLAYTVVGARDSNLLAISRAALATILDLHPTDSPLFRAASEHAAKLINPVKGTRASKVDGVEEEHTSGGEDLNPEQKLAAKRRSSTMDVLGGQKPESFQKRKSAGASTFSDGVTSEDPDDMRDAGWLKKSMPGGGGAANVLAGALGSEQALDEIGDMKCAIAELTAQNAKLTAQNAEILSLLKEKK